MVYALRSSSSENSCASVKCPTGNFSGKDIILLLRRVEPGATPCTDMGAADSSDLNSRAVFKLLISDAKDMADPESSNIRIRFPFGSIAQV